MIKTKRHTITSCLPILVILFLLLPALGLAQDNTVLRDHQKYRKEVLKNMQKVMGKLPKRAALKRSDIQVVDSIIEAGFTRYNILFTVAKNEVLPLYLYIPSQTGIQKKLPAMLVLHETDPLGRKAVDGQGNKANRAHARELAQRGYIVIAPDFPSFGDIEDYNFDTDRYKSGTMKGIFNHMRCIDLLQSRADVDIENIGVLGHSLGGHNSIFLAAMDERVKVAVSSCGWTQLDYYNIGAEAEKKYGGRLGPWAQTRYMPLLRTKYNLDNKKVPFDFNLMISAIAPRAFFSVSPTRDANFDYKGVQAGIALVEPIYRDLSLISNLQVRYPDDEHDFPLENRKEAYAFIDKILGHSPRFTEFK
ncbi:MAG: alpha/beta fold hydrolase [Daejeonella sp.]|uniref:alpha/beta hydrolase n=1 Tax=Daejeonella sp. TaxID=2805397 RepID=UPI00273779FE|nr:alpha/beta fold hydrolase [Daejeonella sp.]MDP3469924.1 alpha/beta fold hydrolase [Daejeonella sp.]